MNPSKPNLIAKALCDTLISPNECDSNFEAANVVDGLFAIARALNRVAKAIEASKTKDDEEPRQ
jgi:hypothetical protein